jgi:hypothetical protein
VEEERTNLLVRSEEFDNANWGKGSPATVTVSTESIASPAGDATVQKVKEATTTGAHFMNQPPTVAASTVHTLSFFAKSAERTLIDVIVGQGTAYTARGFNLSTGVSVANASSLPDAGTANSSIIAYPNGWYRVSVTMTSTQANTIGTAQIRLRDGNSISYTGDGTSGIYLWGAQLEQSSYATSYIPTSGSTATRAADVSTSAATFGNSWYEQSEGTFYWKGKIYSDQQAARQIPFRVTEGSNLRGIGPQIDSRESNQDIFFGTRSDAGSAQITLADTFDETNLLTIAGTFSSDVAGSFNGSTVITDSPSYVFGSEDKMEIMGDRAISGFNVQFNGHTRRITYWPTRLSNDTLQTITV